MLKKQKLFSLTVILIIFSFLFSLNFAFAISTEEAGKTESSVNSITLYGSGSVIEWETDGYSAKGFKIVWSKNEHPTYPLRDGDKYHYYIDPEKDRDTLEAFSGSGSYYARVCEYLGGACGLYSNEIAVDLGSDSTPECTDTDEGKTFNTKGKVVVGENKTWDYCIDSNTLNEMYCSGNALEDYSYKCDFGCYDGACKQEEKKDSVNSIKLYGEGAKIEWETDGYSTKGFKVVWSKNEHPTYPTREGDKYHYFSDPNYYYDTITAFAGDGTYYAKVCEYTGSACGVYSNEISAYLESDKEIKTIEDKAEKLTNNQMDEILAELKMLRNLVEEQQNEIKYLHSLISDMTEVTSALQETINNFITYGVDDNTKKLGAGERAAVMHSYKSAFGKLPENEEEMADAIKIANGRWPSKTSTEAENKAKDKFKKVYKREIDVDKTSDNAAVIIMAYGLRQKAENRNLNSENQGINIFKAIYNKLPETTEEWNVLQAITYSGATR